jgi:hypothetical protein
MYSADTKEKIKINIVIVRFQVLMAASVMFRAVFWVVLPSTIILHGSTTQETALNIKHCHYSTYLLKQAQFMTACKSEIRIRYEQFIT